MGCERRGSDPTAILQQAEVSFQRGDLAQAKLQAAEGYRTFLETNPALAGKFRLLQVQTTLFHGMYASALAELAESPKQIFSECETLARRHLLEAFAHGGLGNDAQVEMHMRQAEQACPNPKPIFLADLAKTRGQLEDSPTMAEGEYLTALQIVRGQHDSYREAAALLNLGNAAMNQEHYDESVDWTRASLQISKRMGYRIYEEKAEGNLGFDYYQLGDLNQALNLLGQADEKARTVDVGYDKVRWRNNSGLVHEKTGQFELAKSDYLQALSMAQQQEDMNQITIALGELAMVSIRSENWDDGAKFADQALDAARREKNHTIELEARLAQGLIASHQGDEKLANRLLSLVARDPDHERESLRWEAQAALADLYAKEKNPKAANSEYRTALDTASRARCTIHKEDLRLPFFANTARLYDSYIDYLVQQGKTVEALKTADQSRALTLAEGLGVEGKNCLASETGLAPQKIAKKLQTAILFYWLGSNHSYLWVVTPAEIRLIALPAAAEIEPLIQAYRKSLLGSSDPLEAGDKSGEQLYRTLVAPAAGFISRNGRVIVVTDGNLSGLSFDSLIAPEPQPHYWIEDVTLANASSLRLLAAQTGRHTTPASRLLLMGNAAASGDPDFPPLLHAPEEMRGVSGHFLPGQEQILNGDRATVAGYVDSHPDAFSYIHFVAHGTASVSDPLDSAVVLSPASQGGGYKLYARDVIAHPLHAELVTISACKGAGTRAYTGEGLVGLSWAFLHAGAHNVIGALWDVSDASTPQLMDRMYAELAKGSSPDMALRTAKLALLHSGSVFHKPVYWAAFQVYTGS